MNSFLLCSRLRFKEAVWANINEYSDGILGANFSTFIVVQEADALHLIHQMTNITFSVLMGF